MKEQKKYYCNPVNINYRYQFNQVMNSEEVQVGREAADPSMIFYHGKYYIFASMTLGVWVSDNLADWENHRLPENLPLYDYAPDVRVIGEYVYFSASSNRKNCSFFRTKDIVNGPYEEIEGTFPFWDPNLFADDDGRVYFYWGCASDAPIYGVELDPQSMKPLTERKPLIYGIPEKIGYERIGDDHSIMPATDEEVEAGFQKMLSMGNMKEEDLAPELIPMIRAYLRHRPYMEGAWMDKYQGKYYLQYACPGTEYNVYGDGVYVGDSPLGPFKLAENNPYSYNPGGFFTGAGHGSTMRDRDGKLWHTATMRISKNFSMERRVGIWPAGYDEDGNLFCNQRYADWPVSMERVQEDPWADPEWYLLSYQKAATASSWQEDNTPDLATDENVRTWWQAKTAEPGEWLKVDIGHLCDVRAVQINFADGKIETPVPGEWRGEAEQIRYIDETTYRTRWVLEGSADGDNWFLIEDKSQADTDLPHDLVIREDGVSARWIRLTVCEVPYKQKPAISGLRVFGIGEGEKAPVPAYTVARTGAMDMDVSIHGEDAVGYNILWGSSPDRLYHSYMILEKENQRIGALVEGRSYYVRVDAFNEAGITTGTVSGPF
ncbi:MAG: family 43 glycosylhydrolase [Clostridiales bacterium]|nr:family 43 glycosylhydrolase [Clostridiales bacterium]